MSSSQIAHQMVKPPIQVFGIEGRYATALYSAASKQKQLDVVEKELIQFQKSIKSEPKLQEFILNPTIKRSLKSDTLKHLAAKISLSPQSANLLQLLAENGRLKTVNKVINAFKVMMAAHRGEVICEVTTAKELDAGQRSKLEGVLKSFLKPKEILLLSTKVDPAIMGGMKVSIADRYVDMSVASKIKKYTDIISVVV